MKSDSIKLITMALLQVQAAMKPVERDSLNGYFNTRFTSLTGVWEAVRPLLTQNGMAVTQLITTLGDGSTGLETLLLHESGEWISGEMPVLVSKEDAQGQGSAITYARRYALASLLGIVQEDDDGNQATQSRQNSGQQQQRKPAQAASGGSQPRTNDVPPCPECGSMPPIVMPNAYGEGFYCNKSKQGCGNKFERFDADAEALARDEIPF